MRFFFLAFILLAIILSLPAKTELAAYPIAGYSNETEFYGGVLSYLRYRSAKYEDTAPKNVFYLSSTYSQKKQFNIFFSPTIHFQNGNYRLESEIQYMKWPTDFYGIGMKTDRDDSESFTAIETSMKTTFVKKLNQFWEVGLYYEFMDFEVSETEENGLLAAHIIPGSENSLTSGIGLKLLFDNRNNTSFPTSGNLGSLQINRFSKLTGSEYDFWEFILDLRKYLQIDKRNTFAVQTFFSSIDGNVPFNQMNYLDENMRAITSKLFVDKNEFVMRLEDRLFFWQEGFKQRLGLAFFAELGEVAGKIDKFNLTDL
ncbi:MAG: BamA/TamA family outer membrane protein, partial [Candidatus Cloacimonetes bacterium]|nr:BamA/TamA family outer membrane protein [Candidatus Cloacimonadota bacterium]